MQFRTYLETSFNKIYEKDNFFFCDFCLKMFHIMFAKHTKLKTSANLVIQIPVHASL